MWKVFNLSQGLYVRTKRELVFYLDNKKRLNDSLYVRLNVLPSSALLTVRYVPANSLLSRDTLFSQTGKDGRKLSDFKKTENPSISLQVENNSKEGNPKEGNSKEGNSKEDHPKEDNSKEDNSKKGDSKEDNSKEGSSKEGNSKEGNSKEGNSKEGNSKEGNSKEGNSKEGNSKEDNSKEEISKEDK